MIGTELYKHAMDYLENKLKDFNFYGCEDLRESVTAKLLDRVDEIGEELDDIETEIDWELENFNFEEAQREEEKNEAIDRLYEYNRDIETDFYLTRQRKESKRDEYL